jgi:hypothetical protein
MVIFGTLLTTLNKPMFAASGWVYASYGTVATVYWVTFAKVRVVRVIGLAVKAVAHSASDPCLQAGAGLQLL